MENSFMIEFKHLGQQRFANVFTRHSDPPSIDVHLLDLHTHNEQRITLNRTPQGLSVLKTSVPIQENLLETIIVTLEQHLSY
jgi:hypothetical protein